MMSLKERQSIHRRLDVGKRDVNVAIMFVSRINWRHDLFAKSVSVALCRLFVFIDTPTFPQTSILSVTHIYIQHIIQPNSNV